MRKNSLAFAVLALIAVLFAGVHIAGRMADESPDAAPGRIRIATGGETGIYYAYGEALANLLEQHTGAAVTTIPSGGAMDNIRMLRSGRADAGFVQNDVMTYAYNGTDLFSTEGAFKDFYALAGLYPETCQIVARRGIGGITDLRGKRVSVGAEGSGTELNALQILEAYGMNDTDVNADHLGFSASVRAFQEGKIDAFFCTAGVPTPAISELAKGGEARILNIGEAHARSIISRYPYYTRQTISPDVYPGMNMDGEAETVAVKAVLAVSGNLSEPAVLEMMKILFENAGEILKETPGVRLSRELAMEGLSIPLHPGAEKFFFGQ